MPFADDGSTMKKRSRPRRTISPRLYTPAEAAEALGISRSKLYQLLAAGRLESIRIGACRRIPVDALEQFIGSLDGSEKPVG